MMDGCYYKTSDGECLKNDDGFKGFCQFHNRSYSNCIFYKPSNADRIRAMTDEELAKFFASQSKIGESWWLNWLKQEATE